MFAGEQRPGSPGSPRNGSGSAEDDDDDDASRHSSEGLNEEDDDAFDAFDDDADDENPRKGTRPKVPWGPEILRHGWNNVEKDFHYHSVYTLVSVVVIGPWSSVEATPPIGPPSTARNASLPTVWVAPFSCASPFRVDLSGRILTHGQHFPFFTAKEREEGDAGHWETRAWETCDIEVWGTTADLGFPVTKDKDIVQSARDASEGRQTNFIVSPEILRFSRQILEKEAPEEEPNECIRTLGELANQWYQEEDTMDPTSPEEEMTTRDQNLATQMGVRCRTHGWRVGRGPRIMRDIRATEAGNQHQPRFNGQTRCPF